jgi:hypothetical protein
VSPPGSEKGGQLPLSSAWRFFFAGPTRIPKCAELGGLRSPLSAAKRRLHMAEVIPGTGSALGFVFAVFLTHVCGRTTSTCKCRSECGAAL